MLKAPSRLEAEEELQGADGSRRKAVKGEGQRQKQIGAQERPEQSDRPGKQGER